MLCGRGLGLSFGQLIFLTEPPQTWLHSQRKEGASLNIFANAVIQIEAHSEESCKLSFPDMNIKENEI